MTKEHAESVKLVLRAERQRREWTAGGGVREKWKAGWHGQITGQRETVYMERRKHFSTTASTPSQTLYQRN
uniref:Uncharacterized protein n=1 Tax=Panagrellus redivivus TaxID=6233 RepID=A0A7E4W1Q6_PANRE